MITLLSLIAIIAGAVIFALTITNSPVNIWFGDEK